MSTPNGTGQWVGFSLAMWIVANLALIGVWDLYVLFSGKPGTWTVSSWIASWAHDFPIGVFVFGILTGHLLWGAWQLVSGDKGPH